MHLIPFLQLMRFDKPVGTLLLLWPTLMALILTHASAKTCIIFILGVVVMRSAGCVINDYADRDFDGHVTRTKMRPIAIGKVSSKQAIGLFCILMFLALALALQLKPYTLLLSVFAAILAVAYPFTKRFFSYPQFILGIAFAWGIFMVYSETMDYISLQAFVLYAAVVCWVLAYDTQYAMADRCDDLRIGISSSAISFGYLVRPAIFVLQLVALLCLLYIGGNIWVIAAAFMTVLYQQWLLRAGTSEYYIKAFKNNNYTGLLMTFALLI